MANPPLQSWLTWLVAGLLRAPLATVLVTGGIVVLAAVYLAQNLAVDTNLDDLIDPDAPFRERQRALEAAFPGQADRIVVVVSGASLDARLAALFELVARAEARPDTARAIEAPALSPFFARHALLYGSVAELEERLDRLAGAQPLLARLAADARPETLITLLADGLERGEDTVAFTQALAALRPIMTAASDGRAVAIPWLELTDGTRGRGALVAEIAPVLDFNRLRPAGPALDTLRRLAVEVAGNHPGVTIALTGEIALEAEELEDASSGAAGAGLISLLLVALVLALGLRTWGGIVAVLVTLLAGLILTGAFAMAAVGSFTMISIAFAVLFIGLGVDFAIHVTLRAQEAAGSAATWREAIVAGTAGAGPALLLCAPTTALAFLSFWPTGYVGLAQLGLIAAGGMVVALVLSLTLLPALLHLLARPRRLVGRDLPLPPRRVTRAAALVFLGLGLAALPLLGEVRFAADPLALKAPEAPSVTAFRTLLAEPDISPYRAELLVADNVAAAAMTAQLEALPEVGRIVSVAALVPTAQDVKLTLLDDARFFLTIPTVVEAPPAVPQKLAGALDRLVAVAPDPVWRAAVEALAAEVRTDPTFAPRLQAAWFRYWPPALDRLAGLLDAGPVSTADLPAELRDRYVAADGRERLEILPATSLEAPEARREFATAVLTAAPDAAGNVVQMTSAGELVARAMVQASALAFAGVTVLVALTLRRASDVTAVMAAVLLAASLTLGAMVLLDVPFNFANVIVLPLLLGFGVDAAIHVVMRRRETTPSAGMAATSTPRAVLLSALTTLASFGTLMLSPHQGTASMGLLLTLALVASLAATLIALPAWLDWRHKT